jgi:hypothetical protein
LFVIRGQSFEGASELVYYPTSGEPESIIGIISRPVTQGLSLSPDATRILYTQVDQNSLNLMLVEKWK